MTTKKKAAPKKPEWVLVDTRDIKYDELTLTELLAWIKDKTPEGTSPDEIKVSFEIDQSTWYYDETIVEATMQLLYLKKD